MIISIGGLGWGECCNWLVVELDVVIGSRGSLLCDGTNSCLVGVGSFKG